MSEGTQGESRPYDLQFEERPDYLVARVSGPKDTLPTALAFWREIADECRRCHYQRLLIIEDIAGNLSTAEIFQLASQLPEMGLRGITTAFVDLQPEQLSDNLFGETVAANRGLFGKVFDNVAAAEQWLAALPKR